MGRNYVQTHACKAADIVRAYQRDESADVQMMAKRFGILPSRVREILNAAGIEIRPAVKLPRPIPRSRMPY